MNKVLRLVTYVCFHDHGGENGYLMNKVLRPKNTANTIPSTGENGYLMNKVLRLPITSIESGQKNAENLLELH